MAIVRSFGSNGQFEVTDWTEEITSVPNMWSLTEDLQIFTVEPVAEHTVTFEEITKSGGLIVDRVRGERSNVSKGESRKIHTFAIPHFPEQDAIYPQDLQNKRAYGSPNDAETLAAVRMRKMEKIRRDYALTLEKARIQMLTAGTIYAPSGTVSQNFFTEFAVSQKSIDFVFGTATTNIIGKAEEGIAHIQDNLKGENYTGQVAICSPKFFSALVNHATTKTAYTYYTTSGAQQILRERLGGNVTRYRTFDFAGIIWIEYRGGTDAGQFITDGDAVLVPQGTDAFKTYFSPANRFGLTNTLGEPVYLFETQDAKGTCIELEAESNFASALLKPLLAVKLTSSTW